MTWLLVGDALMTLVVLALAVIVAVEILAVQALAGIAYNVIAILVTASTVAIGTLNVVVDVMASYTLARRFGVCVQCGASAFN